MGRHVLPTPIVWMAPRRPHHMSIVARRRLVYVHVALVSHGIARRVHVNALSLSNCLAWELQLNVVSFFLKSLTLSF